MGVEMDALALLDGGKRWGQWSWSKHGRLCLEGALNQAALGNPYSTVIHGMPVNEEHGLVYARVRGALRNLGWKAPAGSLAGWNDSPERRFSDVRRVLVEADRISRLPAPPRESMDQYRSSKRVAEETQERIEELGSPSKVLVS